MAHSLNRKKLHKHDPGAYVVYTYTGIGRKRGYFVVANFTRGQRMAESWKRRTGGSAIVTHTLFNTEISEGRW